MRRRPGTLLPLELEILDAAVSSAEPLHGFELARRIAAGSDRRALTAHGTLYKALGRLAEAGLLEAEWEDAETALLEGRPRRRLYRITGEGERRLARERRPAPTFGPAAGLA